MQWCTLDRACSRTCRSQCQGRRCSSSRKHSVVARWTLERERRNYETQAASRALVVHFDRPTRLSLGVEAQVWKLGKRVIRLDVVEDSIRQNIFEHAELPGAYEGDQVIPVENSTIGASSDRGYMFKAHGSHHATVADESLASTDDQSFEADRGCTCSLM